MIYQVVIMDKKDYIYKFKDFNLDQEFEMMTWIRVQLQIVDNVKVQIRKWNN